MNSRRLLLLAVLPLLLMPWRVTEAQLVGCDPGVKVFFVNGILGEPDQVAQAKLDELEQKDFADFSVPCVTGGVDRLFNPSDSLWVDVVVESFAQKRTELTVDAISAFGQFWYVFLGLDSLLSSQTQEELRARFATLLLESSNDNYTFSQGGVTYTTASLIAEFRNQVVGELTTSGRKVILLAHSQGNFFANSVRDGVVASTDPSVSQGLAIVNVANVASRAPNELWLSAHTDWVVNFVDSFPGFRTKPTNFDASGYESFDPKWIHSFDNIYRQRALPTGKTQQEDSAAWKLMDLVKRAIDIAVYPALPTSVSSAMCTAPIATQVMNCTVTGVRLPATTSFQATNCNPSPMLAETGLSSTTQRSFSCAVQVAGIAVEVSYVVPGYSGVLPGIPTKLALAAPTQPGVSVLNDTGATTCFSLNPDRVVSCSSAEAVAAHDKQDGMIGRDIVAPDNSDGVLGFSFEEIPNGRGGSFERTECIRDKITGLVWEGKPVSGARGADMTYDVGFIYIQPTNVQAYVVYVNSIALCGYSDWRLPTDRELQSIVHYGASATAAVVVDEDWFPNTKPAHYRSSGAGMDFASGRNNISLSPYDRYRVRLVR